MQYSVKFVKDFIVKQFKNSTHKILILSGVEKMVWVVLFWVTRLDFLKSHFTGPKYTIEKVVLPGRVKCGGTEGEIVVAHGRLPSPARLRKKMFRRGGGRGRKYETEIQRVGAAGARRVNVIFENILDFFIFTIICKMSWKYQLYYWLTNENLCQTSYIEHLQLKQISRPLTFTKY